MNEKIRIMKLKNSLEGLIEMSKSSSLTLEDRNEIAFGLKVNFNVYERTLASLNISDKDYDCFRKEYITALRRLYQNL